METERLQDLEADIRALKERNARVEAEKACPDTQNGIAIVLP